MERRTYSYLCTPYSVTQLYSEPLLGEYDANARPVREQNTTMDISLELHLNAVMVKRGYKG